VLKFTEDWYQTHVNKSKTRKGTTTPKIKALLDKYISPHAQALAALVKNPTLSKGNEDHYLQVRIFDWLERELPEIYDLTHATPNGGKRGKKTAFAMKAEGQKKGYLDLSIDRACGGFHGFRMEVKFGKNRLTPEQIQWVSKLEREGYKVVVVWTLEDAVKEITDYVSLEELS